jgi:hypothetical protein
VTYYSDGKRYTAQTGVIGSTPLPKPYDVQTTNGIFQVTAWTNLGGLRLPSAFLMYEFEPKQGGRRKEDLTIANQLHATVHTIRLISGSPLPPLHAPPKTWVSERRFASDPLPVPESQYFSDDGAVHPLASVKVTKNHIANARHLETRREKDKSRPWYTVALVVLATVPIAFVFFFYRQHLARTSANKTTTTT